MPDHSAATKAFREVCKLILYSLLGDSACEATLFYMHRSLGRDSFEVLWDDPKSFYRELEKVFGVGAKILIKLLVSRINSELGLNISPERFLELMCADDQHSIEELRSLITKIVEMYRGRRGEGQY
ncbi:hypothetical protein DSO06_00370 [Candidatus Nezhaarchaeota archaeon WYZ-LMO8]|nr:MAG: hypothetical protein DSO05_04845 [Candidatus Nezhaarchaeota archaeon WYZ-LMO7]TDA36324.1 MAG: hypothetical protein DSO06_00370 [Candidatus Nezhaarchaeota archaeon WYZ-LMO8]